MPQESVPASHAIGAVHDLSHNDAPPFVHIEVVGQFLSINNGFMTCCPRMIAYWSDSLATLPMARLRIRSLGDR